MNNQPSGQNEKNFRAVEHQVEVRKSDWTTTRTRAHRRAATGLPLRANGVRNTKQRRPEEQLLHGKKVREYFGSINSWTFQIILCVSKIVALKIKNIDTMIL